MFELYPLFNEIHPWTVTAPRTNTEAKTKNLLSSFWNTNTLLSTDAIENETSYTLKVDVPGFQKENIQVSYENDTLTVKAERKEDLTKENGDAKKNNALVSERVFGSFQRNYYFPQIRAEGITAKLENGVLTLTLPKDIEKATAHSISIDE